MPRLCIVTALPAESRPLLDALHLRHSAARHLRVYSSEHYLLLETGVGKLNAAACTGALLQAYPQICSIVNLGIAGGAFDYAQTLMAHRVCDNASGEQWFPHLPSHKAIRHLTTTTVSSVDIPCEHYLADTVFDMEAAGVFAAASRYLPTSCIHSLKVISDNTNNHIRTINKQTVTTLVSQTLDSWLPALEAIREQANLLTPANSSLFEPLIVRTVQRVHHSVNDEQQLRELIRRYWALSGQLPQIDNRYTCAKTLRESLQAMLGRLPLRYS